MEAEILLFVWVIVIALFPFAELARRRFPRNTVAVFLSWFLLSVGIAWFSRGVRGKVKMESEIQHRPVRVSGDGFVSSDSCRSCHPREYSTWHSSYHRSMTQLATPGAVTGRFAGQTETVQGRRYRLEQVGDEFFAEFDFRSEQEREGVLHPRIRRKIELVTGSHHMQVYWYSTGHSRRLGMLPIVYLHEVERWVPRGSAFLEPPGGYSDESGRWNNGCVDCHTTHGSPRGNGEFDFDTQVAEFGIACESCHGPAEDHIAAHRDPLHRFAARNDDASDPSIVDPAKLGAHRSTEICGFCHAISSPRSEWHARAYRPGDKLGEFWRLTKLHAEDESETAAAHLSSAFWPDGMVRTAGREYNGLMATPCYTHGRDDQRMSCLSCHQSHQAEDDLREPKDWANYQLALHGRDNRACTQCHVEFVEDTALVEHTHHVPGSGGSLCYNCHMPFTSYGLLKAVRSHTVHSPDAAVAQSAGRLTACNQCHLDETLDWAASRLHEWYGSNRPTLSREDTEVSAAVLHALKGDAGQRAIVAWSLGWPEAHAASGQDWIAPYLAQLLEDPYDAVRYIATRSLKRLPGYADFDHDYIGRPDQLADGRIRALKRWQPNQVSGKSRRREVLVDPDGFLMTGRFDHILQQRDNRPMTISE